MLNFYLEPPKTRKKLAGGAKSRNHGDIKQLAKTLIASLDHVNEISDVNRYQLIQRYKSENRVRYSDHYAYITQSCRHLSKNGFFFEDDNLFVCIGFHCEKNSFVLVNPIAKTAAYHKSLIKLCQCIYRKHRNQIYIKHVFRNMFDLLLTKPDFYEISRFPWTDDCYKDDNTYPEVVIDLGKTIADEKGRIPVKKIRLRVNRFYNNTTKNPVLLAYEGGADVGLGKAVEGLIRRWSDYQESIVDSYANMIHHDIPDAISYVAKMGEDIVGFFVFGRIGKDTVGAYANVCDAKHHPGISEVLFLEAGKRLYHEHDIAYVNLGGSEKKDLYRFKTKFSDMDIRTNHVQYVVYSED